MKPVREEHLQRIRRLARRIHKFAVLRAAPEIITQQVVMLFRVAFGAFPKEMSHHFGAFLAGDSRRYIGACQMWDCDNTVHPHKCELPHCNKCVADATAEYFRMEVEEPDDENDAV